MLPPAWCCATSTSSNDVKNKATAQCGSVVLVALCLALVLGIAVAGYVAVCARTMDMSNRSFCTTSTVQLAEFGLEEALWSLNQARPNPASYDWSAAGWTKTDSTVTKSLNGFTINKGIPGTVSIQIDNSDYDGIAKTTLPVITSSGTAQMPDGIPITQQLKIEVKPAVLFSNAVGSTGPANSSTQYMVQIPFGGGLDSYDSSLGEYNSPSGTNRSDKAVVSAPYVLLSNYTSILGYASSANASDYQPDFYEYSTLKGLNSPSSPRVDPARISNNANQYAFDILTPTTAGPVVPNNWPGHKSVGAPTSDYYTSSGIYYVNSDLTLAHHDVLTVEGPAIIIVTGNLTIEDSATIIISDNGTPNNHTDDGSLQIIVGGSFTIEGGGIQNQTMRPQNLAVFCKYAASYIDTSSPRLNTGTPFYGVIYVPNAPLVVGSTWGTAINVEVFGSLVGQGVICYDAPLIHYDLNLHKVTFSVVNTPYGISNWLISN